MEEILPFLACASIHLQRLVVRICTLHNVVLFVLQWQHIKEKIIFLNNVCTDEVSFGLVRSIGLFYLGIAVLTHKGGVRNLGSWQSIPSSLQRLSSCRPVPAQPVKPSAVLRPWLLWEGSIGWGRGFTFDFVFPWFWSSCRTPVVNWLYGVI